MKEILNHLDLPKEALTVFNSLYDKVSNTLEYKEIAKMFKENQSLYLINDKCIEYSKTLNANIYEFNMVVLIANAYFAREKYLKIYNDEQLFLDNFLDFKYKINECKLRYDVWGIEPFTWFTNLYEAKIFSFGRLQFVESIVGEERMIYIHIPSSGPLTHNTVMASYKKAYDFFEKTHHNMTAFVCSSYLLLPDYKDVVFKEGSNTYEFISDFEILKVNYSDEFTNAWRIFYKDYSGDSSVLPQETSMQRAFVKYLENGGKSGTAFGAFMFDGNKIYKDEAKILKKALSC